MKTTSAREVSGDSSVHRQFKAATQANQAEINPQDFPLLAKYYLNAA